MTKTARKGTRMPPELAKALEACAKRQDRTESWIINEALRAYLFPKPRMPMPGGD